MCLKPRVFFKHIRIFLLNIFFINILNAAQHNFYIGANIGTSCFSGKTSNEVKNQRIERTLYSNKSIVSRSILGGLYIGYILRLQNFGMGSELTWQYINQEKTLDGRFDDAVNGDHLIFKIKNQFTNMLEFTVKPGYFICDYFTYAILGINLQNIRCSYNADGETNGGISSFSDKKSKYVEGYTFGAGVQKNIYENVAVGLELKFLKFHDRTYKFNLPSNPGDPVITLSSKLKDIQTYSASLRFMYTF